MIRAGIAEYAAILSGTGSAALSACEPTTNLILVIGGIVFLFWLVVFRL